MHHRHEREMTTMSTYERNDESIPTDTHACYEAFASQEKISPEEEEEKPARDFNLWRIRPAL
jgi:hypothetical protein